MGRVIDRAIDDEDEDSPQQRIARLPKEVRGYLACWPAGEPRLLCSYWVSVEVPEDFGGGRVYINADHLCDLGVLVQKDRAPKSQLSEYYYERTTVPVRRPTTRTIARGPWPWPVPHHLALISKSPLKHHLRWVEGMSGETELPDIFGPWAALQLTSSAHRLGVVREWLRRGGVSYVPTWLERYASPRFAQTWCGTLLVTPHVYHEKTGWTFRPLDGEAAKQLVLRGHVSNFMDVMRDLSKEYA